VDSVIGQHQTVIKTLGNFYKHVKGISGATILGDGSVALILDVVRLMDAAEKQSGVDSYNGNDTGGLTEPPRLKRALGLNS
jgi:chemotaxis protein histidine kinase CheA